MKNPILTLIVAAIALVVLWAPSPRWGRAAGSTAPVTFTKDVAPIFYAKCATCHRPGETAPMSLLTFRDARPWARDIREKVIEKQMPPWHADPRYGSFQNDRSLSETEIKTIVSWVDQGSNEGAASDLPPQPTFQSGWHIGAPDLVLTAPFKYDVPATGTVGYKYFYVPTHFTEDKWIQAAEIRPGNPSVVHHVIVFISQPEAREGTTPELANERRFGALAGTAPGERPMVLPDGVAKLVRAGSDLIFQMHYTPNGTATTDQTSIGIIFAKKPVEKALYGGMAINRSFLIPAGDPDYQVASSFEFRADSHILSLMPHMHLRGKDFQYRIVYPDGTSKILLSVPRYDFNWQTNYVLKQAEAAPKGSRIECLAHFDNSADNKFNPDPAKAVHWGQQTWDEMMIGFVSFTLDRQNLLLHP